MRLITPLKVFATTMSTHPTVDPLIVSHLLTHTCGYPTNTFSTFLQPAPTLPPPPNPNFHASFTTLLNAHIAHATPIQYLLGQWDFHDLTNVICRPPTLIPRPETEQLVEHIIATISPRASVLDVGTGTGCIPCAVSKQVEGVQITAIDVCEQAVALARENVALFEGEFRKEARVTVEHVGIGEFGTKGEESQMGFDVIVSNPPYIPTSVYKGLERNVIEHEARRALDGGVDGMDVVRQVLEFCGRRNGVPKARLVMEVDDGMPAMVLELAKEYGGKGGRRWSDDFGKERFVEVEF